MYTGKTRQKSATPHLFTDFFFAFSGLFFLSFHCFYCLTLSKRSGMGETATEQVTRKRLDEIERELSDLREKHSALKAHWEVEKKWIQTIRSLKERIEDAKQEAAEAERKGDLGKVAEIRYGSIAQLEKELEQANEQLQRVQADGKMLKEEVEAEDIAEIVARWTGIPVQRMLESERTKLLKMEERIHERVIGQEEAVTAVSNAIRRNRADLQDPNRPIGSFIFLGTTGVGKTELARALAEFLFDDEQAMVRIDMSEYMEKFAVSRLIGAPPGYVGYEEGGQLTEAVRTRPYAVLLLDEIEKAHPDVFNILLQVLDDGRLTDGQGRTVNFKNTIIIMTSNMGTELIQERLADITETNREHIMDELREKIIDLLKMRVRPEFLNRVDEVVLFNPLTKNEVRNIVAIQTAKLQAKLRDKDIELQITDKALDWLAAKGFDISYGARPLKRIIQRAVTDKLAVKLLSGDIANGSTVIVDVDIDGDLVVERV